MLHFSSDFDVATFIVHVLALPVLIGCVLASTWLLKGWVEASRPLLIIYNAVVVLTLTSFALQIANSVANASIDYSNGYETIPWRPLLIIDLVADSFDLIFRVATLALVAYITITQTTDLARRRLRKFSSIAAILVLSALTVVYIAFRGVGEGFEEAYYTAVNSSGDVSDSAFEEFLRQKDAVAYWHRRVGTVQLAFYAVCLSAVLSILIASIQTRNRPLRAAISLFLAMTVLEAVSAAWAFYLRTTSTVDSGWYGVYAMSEFIMQIFLQTALLVTLLFAPQPFK